MIETLHGLDALQCRTFRIGEVIRHIHHIHGKAHKTAQVLMHHITRPTRPDGSQACTVRHIKHTTELMLQLMGGPVIADTAARQSVVGHTASPHDLGTMTIVLRIFQHFEDSCFHPAQHSLCQIGGQVHIIVLGEIALHGVHHHIRHTGSCLIGRQGKGTTGIHDGKLRTRHVVAVAQFHIAILIGDNASLTHLTASSWNRQH